MAAFNQYRVDLSTVDWDGLERYLGCREALLKILKIREEMYKGARDPYGLWVLGGIERYLIDEVSKAQGKGPSTVAMWEEDVYDTDESSS